MDKPSRQENNASYHGLIFVLLFGTWVFLSGLMDWFHLSLGIISSALVSRMSGFLLFQIRTLPLSKRVTQALRLMAYFGWLLQQIFLSNLHLLKLAFMSKSALSPQIVRYETKLQSDFEKFLLANSITLTPGTVTMKIKGQTFYIHAISDFSAQGLNGEMEQRIARIFA